MELSPTTTNGTRTLNLHPGLLTREALSWMAQWYSIVSYSVFGLRSFLSFITRVHVHIMSVCVCMVHCNGHAYYSECLTPSVLRIPPTMTRMKWLLKMND